VARWIEPPTGCRKTFPADTGSLCGLDYRDIPAVKVWNSFLPD
jgi:hypothetical protein